MNKLMLTTHRRGFLGWAIGAATALLPNRAWASARGDSPQGSVPRVTIGRRIVTGVDADGKSVVTWEGPVPTNATSKTATAEVVDFWLTDQVPAPIDGERDPMLDWTMANRAPSGGVVGRLFSWAPGISYPFHRTPTVDFIVVLAGQLELELETTTRTLNPGDVVVQRSTVHGWRVIGDEPCTFVAIMLDAGPQS